MDLTELLNAVDAAVWGPLMIILLLGCHIYTTIRTKVIQRKLPLALKLSVTKDDGAEGDVAISVPWLHHLLQRLEPAPS